MRLVKITGVDLNVFEFDFDNTWTGFFLNADEKVLGRYGGRDARSAEGRLSLPGLRYAMQAALRAHRQEPTAKPASRPQTPLLAENYPAARRERGCIHCHQVSEFRREQAKSLGQFRRDDLWIYPLPENVGLTVEVARGNRVTAVAAASPAARAGLQPGDFVQQLNGISVASFADAQYALHRGPWKGSVPITWERDGKAMSGQLQLAEGWKKTNPTWRPSMLDLLPSLPFSGRDLSAAEKKAQGLPDRRLAFVQQAPVHAELQAAGVRENDVIVGLDEQALEMTMEQFLGHVRRNYLVGDRVKLDILRGGKRVEVPLTLR